MQPGGETVILPNGDAILVRPIRPDDRAKLIEGLSRLSPESRFRRFLGYGNVGEAAARYLTEVDGHDHVALVALAETPDLKSEIGLGVARYVKLAEDPATAEAAITVLDDFQQRGVATVLARALYAEAVANGVRRFRAEVLSSNEPMLAILRGVSAVERERSGDTIVFDIPLASPDPSDSTRRSAIARILRAAAETMAFVARGLRHLG